MNLTLEQNNLSWMMYLVVNFTNVVNFFMDVFADTCAVSKVLLLFQKQRRFVACCMYKTFIESSRYDLSNLNLESY